MVAEQDADLSRRIGLSPRVLAFCIFLAALVASFSVHLWNLFTAALENDLNSYIVLIPFVSLYFLHLDRSRLSREYRSSIGWAVLPLTAGLTAIALFTWRVLEPSSSNDRLALITFSFVCLLWVGAFVFLGSKWMVSAAFPMVFLIFLVPLPDQVVYAMELGLRHASAFAAHGFFLISGTPALKTGTVFQLPGITLEVAQECSGIRSTWVLFITSLVAAQLFLTKPMSRIALVLAIIPLGILRNGFRIMVIGLLCIHVDPNMIYSIIHRKGGPIFFALSLIPLLLILWFLRRKELAAAKSPALSNAPQ